MEILGTNHNSGDIISPLLGGLLSVVNNESNGIMSKNDYRIYPKQIYLGNTMSFIKVVDQVVNSFCTFILSTVGEINCIVHIAIANHGSYNKIEAILISGSIGNLKLYYSGTLGKENITLYAKCVGSFVGYGCTNLINRYSDLNNLYYLEEDNSISESNLTEISIQ